MLVYFLPHLLFVAQLLHNFYSGLKYFGGFFQHPSHSQLPGCPVHLPYMSLHQLYKKDSFTQSTQASHMQIWSEQLVYVCALSCSDQAQGFFRVPQKALVM